jgi:copper chaperone
MSKKMIFKTNIKCNGCISTVQPFLDKMEGVNSWNVELDHADKLLHIQGDNLETADIIATLKEAGYQALEIAE